MRSRALLEQRILSGLRPCLGNSLLDVTYACLPHEPEDVSDADFYFGGDDVLARSRKTAELHPEMVSLYREGLETA